MADDAPRDGEGVGVVIGEMIGDAADFGVDIRAAEVFSTHHLAGRGLHQRRPGEEDGALPFDDDRLVAHRRHVSAARGAGAHDARDLRNA